MLNVKSVRDRARRLLLPLATLLALAASPADAGKFSSATCNSWTFAGVTRTECRNPSRRLNRLADRRGTPVAHEDRCLLDARLPTA